MSPSSTSGGSSSAAATMYLTRRRIVLALVALFVALTLSQSRLPQRYASLSSSSQKAKENGGTQAQQQHPGSDISSRSKKAGSLVVAQQQQRQLSPGSAKTLSNATTTIAKTNISRQNDDDSKNTTTATTAPVVVVVVDPPPPQGNKNNSTMMAKSALSSPEAAVPAPAAVNRSNEEHSARGGDSTIEVPIPLVCTNASTTNRSSLQPLPPLSSFSSPRKQTLPNNRTLLVVHVGKTGGSSIKDTFRVACAWFRLPSPRKACFERLHAAGQESQLSQHAKSYWHTGPRDQNTAWARRATSYVFTIRDPVNRLVSAYLMGHPRNQKGGRRRQPFYQCFPTPQALALLAQRQFGTTREQAQYLSLRPATTEPPEFSPECVTLGRQALHGGTQVDHSAYHVFVNYLFYTQKTLAQYPRKEVMVVRTEHLWDDLKTLDRQLGGTGQHFASDGNVKTHGSEGYRVTAHGLTRRDKISLCCGIAHEIGIYQDLLLRAVNLSPAQKCESLSALFQQCGVVGESSKAATLETSRFDWMGWQKDSCIVPAAS